MGETHEPCGTREQIELDLLVNHSTEGSRGSVTSDDTIGRSVGRVENNSVDAHQHDHIFLSTPPKSKMSQTALITGATGLLGRQVIKAFDVAGYDVVGTGFSRAEPPKIRKVDIQNTDEIEKLFNEVKYEAATNFSFAC